MKKTKMILSVLILFLQSYSQENPKTYSGADKCTIIARSEKGFEITCPQLKRRSHPHIMVNTPKIRNDTLWISHNETYALYSNTFQEGWAIKIDSMIRGELDTTNYLPIIRQRTVKVSCHGNKLEMNKSYLMLNVIEYQNKKEGEKGSLVSLEYGCENILPDTPENREMLIKRYDRITIIKDKPKPEDGKKK